MGSNKKHVDLNDSDTTIVKVPMKVINELIMHTGTIRDVNGMGTYGSDPSYLGRAERLLCTRQQYNNPFVVELQLKN